MENNENYFEFPIGRYCGKDCLFCSEGGKGTRKSFVDLEEFKKVIYQHLNNKNYFKKVILSAGEPILNKDLTEYIRFCKKLDIEVGLVTAWEKGFGEEFIKSIIDAGLNEIMFSMEGTSKVHDFLVQKQGAFNEIIKAIFLVGKLKTKNFKLIIHINLNKINFRYIPRLLKFLYENFPFIDKFYIQVLEPIGKAKKNYNVLMLPYSQFLPIFFDEISQFENNLFNKIAFGILPYCVVPEEYHSKLGKSINIYDGAKSQKYLFLDSHYNDLKFYSEKCNSCKKNNNCNLFFKYYIKKFGDSEIQPYL